MKAKVNLNSEGLKKFFADHGEKVAFAVLLVLAGWIGYSGSQIPVYGEKPATGFGAGKAKTADELYGDIQLADDTVSHSHDGTKLANALTKDGVAPPKEKFLAIVNRLFLSKIEPAYYALIEWNRPLKDTKSRRGEPVYLAVRDVRASFHHGALKFGGETKKIGGEEWICVTALVPNELQIDEYRKAFQNATDSRTNAIPRYFLYKIRRLEVDPLAPADASLNWEQAPVIDLVQAVDEKVQSWDGLSRELADPRFVQWPNAPLTEPLPPVADPSTLGEWVAHIPEIPLAPVGGTAPAQAQPQQQAPAQQGGGVFGARQGNQPQQQEAPAPAATNEGPAKPPQYVLFRFFDFDIEPRKTYRYQVQLVLHNPNLNLNQAYLEKPDLAHGEYRETPWSSPSPAARFPVLEDYFAGNLETANGDGEAVVNVALRRWYPPFGAEIFHEFTNRLRGAPLNAASGDVFYRLPGKPEAANTKIEVKTDGMLVDFSWEKTSGRQLTAEGRPINRPSEVLVLSPRGELMIRSQLMNWSQWEEFKGLVAGSAPQQPAGRQDGLPQPPPDNKPGPFNLLK